MYIPKYFQPRDEASVEEFLKAQKFATLVTVRSGVPVASHLPVEYRTAGDRSGTVWSHMARANRQWRELESVSEVLLIFRGPGTYISPAWYGHTNVPTWNYIAVHAYGKAALLSDGKELRAMLARLVDRHESPRACPVRFDEYPEDFLNREIRGVVGFRVDITRVEANFKLSQNRNDEDHATIVRELEKSGDPDALAIARAMRESRA